MSLARRHFLSSLAAFGFGGSGCRSQWGCSNRPARAGSPLLAVPPGFEVQVIQQSGSLMSDGLAAPALPDGMGCFELDGDLVLLRNHELDDGLAPHPGLAFDERKAGGVTRLVLDRHTLAVKQSHWVLTGSSRNCAGGTTPWGWLSCEESRDDGHGWVFLCDKTATEAVRPVQLASLGRFRHEAAVYLDATRTTYMTEDETDSALYKHVGGDEPFIGSLSALRIVGQPGRDLARGVTVGQSLPVEWVPIADPGAKNTPTALQAHDSGAARISRGEGMWATGERVYFTSTDGGPLALGQVFCLHTGESRLELVAQAETEDTFASVDNVTVAPNGCLYFVEDGSTPNQIWRLTAEGKVVPFGSNLVNGGESEFAGICFSPGGETMFVNLQHEGLTLAVTGPFNTL